MRSLKDVRLKLDGLTVLIGENGSGKSTIVEAFELVRKTVKRGNYVMDSIHGSHGGLTSLLRQGAHELSIVVTIEGDGARTDYGIALQLSGTATEIAREWIDTRSGAEGTSGINALLRNGSKVALHDIETNERKTYNISPGETAVSSFGVFAQPPFQRLVKALASIDAHIAFDTRPVWISNETQQFGGMRWPVPVDQVTIVERLGANLANCFQTLRNSGQEIWDRIIESARLGLGEDLRDISLPSPSRGKIALELVFGDLTVPVTGLSDGQLAYLGFIALAELGNSQSIVVYDEPELHLHPGLIARVAWLLEEMSEKFPVIVATHSDRLLDSLDDPARCVVLCELDAERATTVRRPDKNLLGQWLEKFRGYGAIRNEGYEPYVYQKPSHDEDESDEGCPL